MWKLFVLEYIMSYTCMQKKKKILKKQLYKSIIINIQWMLFFYLEA